MFIDRARVFVKAGDSGDGMSSFRREICSLWRTKRWRW